MNIQRDSKQLYVMQTNTDAWCTHFPILQKYDCFEGQVSGSPDSLSPVTSNWMVSSILQLCRVPRFNWLTFSSLANTHFTFLQQQRQVPSDKIHHGGGFLFWCCQGPTRLHVEPPGGEQAECGNYPASGHSGEMKHWQSALHWSHADLHHLLLTLLCINSCHQFHCLSPQSYIHMYTFYAYTIDVPLRWRYI